MAILLACIVLAVIILCLGETAVQKIGTIASVIIASVVCWIEFRSHKEDVAESRENQLISRCTTIATMILSRKGRKRQNVDEKNSANDEFPIPVGGNSVLVKYNLFFSIHSQVCDLNVTIYYGSPAEYFESVMLNFGNFGRSVMMFKSEFNQELDKHIQGKAIDIASIDESKWKIITEIFDRLTELVLTNPGN